MTPPRPDVTPTLTPAAEAEAPGTRERLIAAMLEALRRRGLHGVGLSELLARADAPKGVLYHHFPGGKTELAVVAIRSAVDQVLAGLDRALVRYPHPADALTAWMGGAQKFLADSGFERGCPLATVALESTPQDTALRAALHDAFATLRERLGLTLAACGLPPEGARAWATLMVAAYEGALLQSRVAGDTTAMRDTADVLVAALRAQIDLA
jgi:TetR/AcrR family transcriptional repressor of lmrAB and yxaGH operons